MNIGERVREARQALDFTQEELAELAGLGLDRHAVIQIEKGKRSVKAEELYEFARVLERPLVYFLTDEPVPQSIVARRGNAPENRDAIRAQLRVQRWLDDYAEVAQLVDPDSSAGFADRFALTPTRGSIVAQACVAAREQRKRLERGSEPIADLRRVLEDELGVPIFGEQVPDTDFCGLLAARGRADGNGNRSWAILVNSTLNPTRCRFTAAHELGHLILRSSAKDYAPHAFFRTDPVDSTEEMFANAFAAEFLAPLDGLRQCDAENIDESQPDSIMALAVRFGVSFQMMTWRLADLRCFDKAAAKELIDSVSPTRLPSFKWGRQEFDGLSPRFCEYVVRAYMEGLLPEGRCAEMLGKTTLQFVEMVDEISAECPPEAAFDAAG